MYHHRARHDPVELAFTDRHGGVSAAPFDSLNLAIPAADPQPQADEPQSVRTNLARVLDDFAPGRTVADLSQVHGAEVVQADPSRTSRPAADGIVTNRDDVVLLIRVADCVPVLLADLDAGVIGGAHAGRPGVFAGVVGATVAAMRDLGAERMQAWIGPHVCGRCYEVPAALQQQVAEAVPATVATTSWGTPSLDLGAGVRAQLEAAGVASIHDVSACTRETPSLFSYRRDGAASGRLAGLVRLR